MRRCCCSTQSESTQLLQEIAELEEEYDTMQEHRDEVIVKVAKLEKGVREVEKELRELSQRSAMQVSRERRPRVCMLHPPPHGRVV